MTTLDVLKEQTDGQEGVTNSAEFSIGMSIPYRVELTIEGVADLLFHRWNNESVEGERPKGSLAKKTDNVESYVWRTGAGNIGIPGEYLRQSIIHAAKFRQDPRSPRKSAMDLFKAAIVSLTPIADLGKPEWDYLDRRRVVIQRNAVTRTRPAFLTGWRATFILMCNLPEYISPPILHEVVNTAGRLVGIADYRPTYGRFLVTHFAVLPD